MRRYFLLLILAIAPVASAARISLAVFPLVNKSGDSLAAWGASAVPEYFARSLSRVEGIRVWDPLFMFQTDSSGWNMLSDSLLQVHHSRWQWDAAIGGTFAIIKDSLRIELQIAKSAGTKQHLRMEIVRASLLSGSQELLASLVTQVCALLQFELSSADSIALGQESVSVQPAYRTYCAGYGQEMRGNYAEALTAYYRAVYLMPAFTVAWCRLGNLLMRSGNSDQALAVIERVSSAVHQTPQTRAMLAGFLVATLPPPEALRRINSIRGDLEKSAAGLTVLGRQYLAAGEFQRATAAFQRTIAWGASDLDAEFLLATTYLWSGEYGTGIELLQRLIFIRPDYLRYHVSLAAMYRKSGMSMEALAVLNAIGKREPGNVMVMIETAHVCFSLGWYRKAGQLLEQARQLKPDQVEILVDLGVIYWHERRSADAVECFRRASLSREGTIPSLVNNGDIAFVGNDIENAIAAYHRAERSGGRNTIVLYNLAAAYRAKGDYRRSARYLDELLQLTPGRIDLHLERARLARMLGKPDDAQGAFRRILENDPYHEAATDGLVRLLIDRGAYEEAVSHIERYLMAKPARGDMMALLAETYRAQGWYEAAVEKYELVIKEFPEYREGYLGIGRCMYDLLRFKNSQKYDETLYALKQATQHASDNPEPWLLMGDIYMDYKGYRDMAIEQWRTALLKTKDERDRRAIERKIAAAREP